jgi:hypothetical protein
MALTQTLSNAAASLAADAVTSLLDAGYLRIYDGAQPADPQTAISGQTLLAELRWNADAFAAAVDGAAAANALTADPSANNTGTAAWFRALQSDGATAVFDGSVGTSGCNLNLSSVAIEAGAAVAVTSYTYTQQRS